MSKHQLNLHIEWNPNKTQVVGFIGSQPIIEFIKYNDQWTVGFEVSTPRAGRNRSYIDGVQLSTVEAVRLLSTIKLQTINAIENHEQY